MTNKRHKINYCIKCGFVDLTEYIKKCSFCNSDLKVTEEFFDEICNNSNVESREELEEYVRQNYVYFDEGFNEDLMEQRENSDEVQNQVNYYEEKFMNNKNNNPTCPTCKSSNIENISISDKAVGGVLFGIFSSNVRNVMRCKDCGYKW